MDNQTEVSIKFSNSVTNLKRVQEYAEQLSIIKSVLSGIDTGKAKELDDSAKSTNEINKDIKDMAKKIKIAFNIGTIKGFSRALRRIFTIMSNLATKSSDYLENINLFQVAFDNNYASAEKFVNKLTEMYGLDESWLIKTVGIFKQLSNAMNLSTEQGTKLSTLLTQMSLDISSLYNIDISRASSVLQSAMAGQTRPIRSATGADITQATLQQTLNEIDIDRPITQLSYAEKRLITIVSLTKQLTEATNDFGRTIESPANQMRILNEQWQRLSRAVGNLFMPIIAKVLPYLNAILMVMTEIINTVAVLLGFNVNDYDYFSGIADSVLDLEDGLEGASESAKKLKQGLRGFDKLNVITTPSSATATTGGTGTIDPKIWEAFNDAYDEYNSKLENIQMKATKIRDAIMEWLGFTKEINEETGDISFKFDHITGGTVLGGLAVGGIIFSGISTVYGWFKKITGLNFGNISKIFGKTGIFGKNGSIMTFVASNPKLLIILASIVAIIVAFKKLYDTNEEFRKKVDFFVDMVKKDIKPFLESFLENLKKPIKDIWDSLKKIYETVIKPLCKILLEILEPVLNALFDILIVLWREVIEPLMPVVQWLIDMALKVIVKYVQNTVELLQDIIIVVQTLWINYLKPLFEKVMEKIQQHIIPAIQSIGDVIETIKNAIQAVVDWWNKLTLKDKSTQIHVSSSGNTHGGGSRGFAKGGLPPVGQLFVANEKGAELVGHIGGKTFVANQNQMMELLDRKLGQAGNTGTQVFNIYLDENHKLGTYTLDQLKDMAKSNGKPIMIS